MGRIAAPRTGGPISIPVEELQRHDSSPDAIDDGQTSYAARVRAIASTRPNHAAIIHVHDDGREERLTYAQWDRAADRLAHRLMEAGARSDSVVVITLPNGIAFFVAILATWRIGACPAMLKYDFTTWERERYLAVARPVVMISDWPEANCPCISRRMYRPTDQRRTGHASAGQITQPRMGHRVGRIDR